MHKINECLIVQAQFKAGAQVHNVNTVIGTYKNWAQMIERFGAKPSYIDAMQVQEQKLRKFISTGILDMKSR